MLIAEPPSVSEGVLNRVVFDFEAPESVQACTLAADASARELASMLGVEAEPLDVPRDILVFELRDSFIEGVRAFGGDGVTVGGSYVHWDSGNVLLQAGPGMSRACEPLLGPSQFLLRSVGAQAAQLEGARQIPAWKNLPEWLREGLSTLAAQRALERLAMVPPLERDPLVREAVGRAPSDEVELLGHMMEDPTQRWVDAALGGRDTNAAAYYPLLADAFLEREGSADFLRSLASIPAGPRALALVNERVASRVDGARRSALREGVSRRIASLTPAWTFEGALAEIDPDDEVVRVRAIDRSNVVAWRAGSSPSRSVSGALTIAEAGARQLNVLLRVRGDGLVAVNFAAGRGVAISAFDPRQGDWRALAGMAAEIPVGEPVRFEIGLRSGGLEVLVDGQRVVTAERLVPSGGDHWVAWGVGAQAGCAGEFSALKAD